MSIGQKKEIYSIALNVIINPMFVKCIYNVFI